MSGSRSYLLGRHDESLRALLADALAELQVELHVDSRKAPFDLVLAVITPVDIRRVLAEARGLADRAPILVVMSMWDHDCEELSYRLGAAAYWALEWPITRLSGLVTALTAPRRRTASD